MNHIVPEGWKRGDPLVWLGGGPRYAAMRDRSKYPIYQAGLAPASDIGAIEFNSLDEAKAFDKWWKEGVSV